ncbi:MAG: hypothetical protein R6U04_04370 [Bacteroidales bacterium]
MKIMRWILSAAFILLGISGYAQDGSPDAALLSEKSASNENVTIVWSTSNPDVLDNFIDPYFDYSAEEQCWNNVNLVVMGPAVNVLSENQNLQTELSGLISNGLNVKACKYSTEKYNAKSKLTQVGIEVENVYDIVTQNLKDEYRHLVAI